MKKDWNSEEFRKIGIIGGTGNEGKGLALRFAKAGYEILIGSRTLEKARAAADEINVLTGHSCKISGVTNHQAAETADLVILTVPFSAHRDTLETIKPYLTGKILIDVTVPLVPPKITVVQMPESGSATLEAQQILGDDASVVAAFQNVSYDLLLNNEDLNCDILVCGNEKKAREAVIETIRRAGFVGVDAGPLQNAVVVEGLTSILLGINKRFGIKNAGIQITGIPREQE